MPRIEPFKGVLYNSKKVDISRVVAPPYDVISPKMQDDLYRASEYNVVRLILGKEEPTDSRDNNKYKRAGSFFNAWLNNKILVQEGEPAIYVYGQEYRHLNKKKSGLGFIARMKIEDPKTSRVLPHEKTFAKPKEDRLNLIREVKANLSSIFTLFEDRGHKVSFILKHVMRERPDINVRHEGVRHALWRLKDEATIGKIQELMGGKDIFIADGHHRYEVAVNYRNEMREKKQRLPAEASVEAGPTTCPYDYVMMYFSPMDDRALTIMSTHRLIKQVGMPIDELLERLRAYFDIKEVESDKLLFKEMDSTRPGEYAFGMHHQNKSFCLLTLKKGIDPEKVIREDRSAEWKTLDVSVLHSLIFDNIMGLKEKIASEENVIYARDPDYAVTMVDKGSCEAAFFLNPATVTQVRDIARIGDTMPHKSTYFYPKLLTGLVINSVA